MSAHYQDTSCPECGSDDTQCVNPSYGVWRCLDCEAHFDESDGAPSRERAARTRLTEHDE